MHKPTSGTAQCTSWSTTVGREYEVDYELHMHDPTYKGDCVHGHSSTENVVANDYADCDKPCHGHRHYECACVSAEFAHEAHSDKRTVVSRFSSHISATNPHSLPLECDQLYIVSGACAFFFLAALNVAICLSCGERKRAAATAQTPAAQTPDAPQPISIQVPANGYPGMALMVQNPLTGQMMTVQVPANAPPGSFFNVMPPPTAPPASFKRHDGNVHASCNAAWCVVCCCVFPMLFAAICVFAAAYTYDMDQYYNGC